jgi:Domain of unknown function (DUF397)
VGDRVAWRKATRSASSGECVEVGTSDGRAVAIRDSKRPDDGHLTITPAMLGELLATIRSNRLNVP